MSDKMLWSVEWTDEPEMDYVVNMTDDEAALLKRRFEDHDIPHKIDRESDCSCSFEEITEILDEFIEDH